MKLLLENWRKLLIEQTGGMGDSAPKNRPDKLDRAKAYAESQGFHFVRKLGEGKMGEVYLVENKETGERNAMKQVVKRLYGGPQTADREAKNYRFAMNNKSSMNQRFAKYLPDVYNVVDDVRDYFIFMEVLEKVPDRIKADLFALNWEDSDLDAYEKHQRIFKDPTAVYDIARMAIIASESYRYLRPEIQDKIMMMAPKIALKVFHSDENSWDGEMIYHSLADAIWDGVYKYAKHDPMLSHGNTVAKVFKDQITDETLSALQKQLVPIHQGYGATHPAGRQPQSIEILFPEAYNLRRAMKYFHEDEKWQPKDVHSGNVMVRPNTKDFVITDLGLFNL